MKICVVTIMCSISTVLLHLVTILTPGNVVRLNPNYANEILTGASGNELQSVDRMSTNLLSLYLEISKRKNRQFGNVIPKSFYFYTRLITKLHEKTSMYVCISTASPPRGDYVQAVNF